MSRRQARPLEVPQVLPLAAAVAMALLLVAVPNAAPRRARPTRPLAPPPAPAPQDARATADGLALEVTTHHQRLGLLEWPTVQASLVNRGTSPVTVIAPGIGSAEGLRTPSLAWSVRDQEDDRPHAYKAPRSRRPVHCGNIPPLTADEIVELAPGASIPVPLERPLYFPSAGTYRVRLWYHHDPAAPFHGWRILAPDTQALWPKVEAIPLRQVASNELVFQVGGAPSQALP